jgi:hypothetical protein
MVLLGLAIATALPQIAFAQTDPFPGTWQLNLAKSKYSPGPPPRSDTANVEGEGQNHKLTFTEIDAAGNPHSVVITWIYDGMPHPAVNPNGNFDASAYTRVDANTIIRTHLKAGKLVGTQTIAVSPDSKTLTATAIDLDANGRQINNITVWDKQ